MSESETQIAFVRELLDQTISYTHELNSSYQDILDPTFGILGTLTVTPTEDDIDSLSMPLLFGDSSIEAVAPVPQESKPVNPTIVRSAPKYQRAPKAGTTKQSSVENRGNFRERHPALFYGSAMLVVAGIFPSAASAFDRGRERDNRATGSTAVNLIVSESTAQSTSVLEPVDSFVTTTEDLVLETTISPRQSTLLEAVASGQYRLEDMPGTNVGTLNLGGICLDDVKVSVSNAVEIADIPVGTANPEEARSLYNPLYRVETDDTPQLACDMPGQSEHAPRWAASTKGSQRIKNVYDSPAEMVPQANIHPYSVLPGKVGVTYIQGHRTSYSAPFKNIDALQAGQTATFSDGFNSYNYVFQGFEQVDPNINVNEILAKTIDGKNTLIISTCDEGDSVRLLAIFEIK